MDPKPLVVAILESRLSDKKGIFQCLVGENQYPIYSAGTIISLTAGTSSFLGQDHLLIDLTGSALASVQEIANGLFQLADYTNVILITCDSLHLEQGLTLLAHMIQQTPVKEKGIPIILCVSLCVKARIMGLLIDFDLLEDVLQIPVLPFTRYRPSSLDDIKAAITYAGKRHFSYDCLDFSPKKLAKETCRSIRTPYGLLKKLPLAHFAKPGHAFTHPVLGAGLTALTFFFLFWSTLTGAALISNPIQQALVWLEQKLAAPLALFHYQYCPSFLCLDQLASSIFHALAWVLSVMLPLLVFFVPLCVLLEEIGLLSRIAFCTDRIFEKCGGCGKQCLVMAMGVGCHEIGLAECRKIQSPRERMAALLTLCLIPCGGRIYTLLTLLALFFTTGFSNCPWTFPSLFSAACLTAALFISAVLSMGVTGLLSHTLLKRKPSFFTLKLPAMHKPRLHDTVFPRSFDQTCFILGKAATMAALAGLILYFLANIQINKTSLLTWLSCLLEPLGHLLGMDGTIIIAFILSFPADELILPIILMAYQAQNSLGFPDLAEAQMLLTANGWTWQTALSVVFFTLYHWPCASVLAAVRKESGSLKWTAAAIAIPTLCGLGFCALITGLSTLFFP